jgi:hypothetical protein
MKKTVSVLLLVALLGLGSGAAHASGLAWQDHAPPFSFLFLNHIDSHQQSRVAPNGRLQGFFYIEFTGNVTPDGIREAMHADCTQSGSQCVPGWSLKGVPMTATLVSNEMMAHPVWCVDGKKLAQLPGYSHFHWLGEPQEASALVVGQQYAGYLLQLRAVDTFFFAEHGGSLVTPGIDTYSHYNITTGCN